VVSELPPGVHPTRQGFLARNRIIAALSGGTLVVEASLRSGSASTVARALELGREVMAVPGPITSATSVGTHALLREGATLITCADDVIEAVAGVGSVAGGPPLPIADARDALSADQRVVLDAFPARNAIDEGRLAVRAGVDPGVVLRVLGLLTVEGWVERVPTGWRLTEHARTS
jgi:DNA processing protein